MLVASALLFPALGAGPLERAEIYFLDGARGMLETGDLVVPRYQGQAFFDKPILSYWLMAGAFEALGTRAVAARGVSALAALGGVLAAAWLGRRLFGDETALAGAAVLATTLTFVAFGRIAMSDLLLTLFTTPAVAVAAHAFWKTDAPA
ncbi:MAG TPA: glycosyltransferase family 39 protein, partial [Vicinamibacteria bacterium]